MTVQSEETFVAFAHEEGVGFCTRLVWAAAEGALRVVIVVSLWFGRALALVPRLRVDASVSVSAGVRAAGVGDGLLDDDGRGRTAAKERRFHRRHRHRHHQDNHKNVKRISKHCFFLCFRTIECKGQDGRGNGCCQERQTTVFPKASFVLGKPFPWIVRIAQSKAQRFRPMDPHTIHNLRLSK